MITITGQIVIITIRAAIDPVSIDTVHAIDTIDSVDSPFQINQSEQSDDPV